jgi:putative tricarboxylic transport membrane protein
MGVDLIVHGPPGSAPPVLADAIAAAVRQTGLDPRPWRLVSRGDDPGVDAMATLAARPGDGEVLSTCTPVFLQAPLLRRMALTHRALTPLARLVADRYLIVARADVAWQTPDAFLAELQRRPTRTAGYFKGGINHLLALAIAEATGADVQFQVVPDEPAVWAGLSAGSLDWGSGVAAEVLPHIEAGRLRPIAALDLTRLPRFPDVPTLAEAGVPVTFRLWRGLIGPGGLSAEARERWDALIAAAVRMPAWRDYLDRNGQTDDLLMGEGFAAFLETEWDWYERQLGRAGLLP